jgi:hypothetical protein
MMQKNRRRIRGDTIFTPAREFSQIRFEEWWTAFSPLSSASGCEYAMKGREKMSEKMSGTVPMTALYRQSARK